MNILSRPLHTAGESGSTQLPGYSELYTDSPMHAAGTPRSDFSTTATSTLGSEQQHMGDTAGSTKGDGTGVRTIHVNTMSSDAQYTQPQKRPWKVIKATMRATLLNRVSEQAL